MFVHCIAEEHLQHLGTTPTMVLFFSGGDWSWFFGKLILCFLPKQFDERIRGLGSPPEYFVFFWGGGKRLLGSK